MVTYTGCSSPPPGYGSDGLDIEMPDLSESDTDVDTDADPGLRTPPLDRSVTPPPPWQGEFQVKLLQQTDWKNMILTRTVEYNGSFHEGGVLDVHDGVYIREPGDEWGLYGNPTVEKQGYPLLATVDRGKYNAIGNYVFVELDSDNVEVDLQAQAQLDWELAEKKRERHNKKAANEEKKQEDKLYNPEQYTKGWKGLYNSQEGRFENMRVTRSATGSLPTDSRAENSKRVAFTQGSYGLNGRARGRSRTRRLGSPKMGLGYCGPYSGGGNRNRRVQSPCPSPTRPLTLRFRNPNFSIDSTTTDEETEKESSDTKNTKDRFIDSSVNENPAANIMNYTGNKADEKDAEADTAIYNSDHDKKPEPEPTTTTKTTTRRRSSTVDDYFKNGTRNGLKFAATGPIKPSVFFSKPPPPKIRKLNLCPDEHYDETSCERKAKLKDIMATTDDFDTEMRQIEINFMEGKLVHAAQKEDLTPEIEENVPVAPKKTKMKDRMQGKTTTTTNKKEKESSEHVKTTPLADFAVAGFDIIDRTSKEDDHGEKGGSGDEGPDGEDEAGKRKENKKMKDKGKKIITFDAGFCPINQRQDGLL